MQDSWIHDRNLKINGDETVEGKTETVYDRRTVEIGMDLRYPRRYFCRGFNGRDRVSRDLRTPVSGTK